tara:strand:- start:2697 stop:5432 length:2736 start_codon:yes stop_codon:yes gene_type:complete
MEYIKDEYSPDQYSETPVLRNEDVVATYTNRLTAANAYDGSVQEARDLYKSSMSVTPPEESNGIPSDDGNAPITTPDIQLGEQEQPLMARLFNSAPEPLQRMLTPFLVPFTNNKALKGVTIGIGDGINGALGMLRDINNAVVESNGGVGISQEDWLKLPEIIERGDSTTEAIVGGLTQFMSIYGALGKVSSVNKMSSKGKKLFDDMWRGGLADAAFDPEEGNLATLINMLDEDKTVLGLPIGQMNGAFTQWLGTPVGEDAEAFERLEQRAKNLMEGAGLGMLAHGLVAAIKGMKKVMVEYDPDKFFAMLKKAGFDVDPRSFLFENTLGAENIQTPKLNELGMYSQLEKAMLNLTQDTNKPDDLLRYLTKNGVTNDELNNSGVMDLINEKKKTGESITKAEVGEIFEDMDVTQSYEVIKREYGANANSIDSMSDEDDLLAIYEKDNGINMDNAHMFDDDEVASMNGKVLDHDEVDADIEYAREEIMRQFDDDVYAGDEAIKLFGEMNKLYPEKYPQADDTYAPDEWYDKLRNINIDDEFRQHAEEATRAMAEADYDADPIFKWDLAEGDFQYTITGNESGGYQTEVYRSEAQGGQRLGQSTTGLDVVYSPTEAMVQVRSHNDAFMHDAVDGGTKWSENIVNTDAVSTYKETVITADSPSGTVFSGGQIHFPEKNKAFHLRTTEPNANTLYIEELQSDWAGDISKKGVKKGDEYNQSVRKALQDAVAARDKFLETTDWEFSGHRLMGNEEELVPRNKDIDGDTLWKETDGKVVEQIVAHNKIVNNYKAKVTKEAEAIPQSPLPNDKYINVGLRTAIAQAIDAGQTRVEWTPAQVHIDRWSGRFEEMYKILYDKKLGGIAKRIANKYNAKAGQHYIEISPEMIAHHKSGKGDKLMATAPAIPAAQVANDKEDNS